MTPRPTTLRRLVTRGRAAAVLIGCLGLAACSGDNADKQPAASTIVVAAEPIEWQDAYEMKRSYVGRVEPTRQVDAAFDLAGRLETINVDEGDAVPGGDLIASLETDRLQRQRASFDAQRAAAAAKLDELRAGPRTELIEAARAEVARAKANAELATITTGRQQRLSTRGATSGQSADEARLTAAAAKAAYEAAAAKLSELETGTRAEQIAAQEATVAQLAAEVSRIDLEIQKSSLFAPFSAIVAARMVDQGATLTAGQSVLTLLERDRWQVRLGVPAEIAETLERGMLVTGTVREQSLELQLARVRRDRLAATRTVPLLFNLAPSQNNDERPVELFAGDLVRVQMDRTITERGFWLPIGGLVEGVRGLSACYVATPSDEPNATHQLRRVPLEVLHSTADRAFVRGPVDAEARVVVAGTHKVVPKQIVTLKPATETAPADE